MLLSLQVRVLAEDMDTHMERFRTRLGSESFAIMVIRKI